jgi:hypothetical protein
MPNRAKRARPGSPLAVRLGCLCPQIDNHYGRGNQGNGRRKGWIISGFCKMHGDSIPIPGIANKKVRYNGDE